MNNGKLLGKTIILGLTSTAVKAKDTPTIVAMVIVSFITLLPHSSAIGKIIIVVHVVKF